MKMKRHELNPDIPPSVQLRDAKDHTPRMTYLPHVGAKQRAKEKKRMEKQAAKKAKEESQ